MSTLIILICHRSAAFLPEPRRPRLSSPLCAEMASSRPHLLLGRAAITAACMGWGGSGACSDTSAVKCAPLGTRFPHFCPKAVYPELHAQRPLSKEGSASG